MIDTTKPVQMRDGTPVELVCTDLSCNMSLLGTYTRGGAKQHTTWHKSGRWRLDMKTGMDLVNAPEVLKMYANFYDNRSPMYVHVNKEAALACAAGLASRAAAPVLVTILPGDEHD